MKKELHLVREFHEKFHDSIQETPANIGIDRATFRYNLIKEELEEYIPSVEKNDVPNIAKELADILYAVYGTVIEHGLQDKIEAIFAEVHRSNMSKSYHELKMIKGDGYIEADTKKYFT